MVNKFDHKYELTRVEIIIKDSIRWAIKKNKDLLYNCFYQDTSLFWFSPENAGTIKGFVQFTELTEQVFMNPAFKAVSSDFKNLQITFSRSGDCAWWSCYLDDFNEWKGKPSNWENVRWTGVLEKIDGQWKIRQMHFFHAAEDFRAK